MSTFVKVPDWHVILIGKSFNEITDWYTKYEGGVLGDVHVAKFRYATNRNDTTAAELVNKLVDYFLYES